MNKTVNINLANTFFHIDEEAYAKLRRYLESIKKSFDGTPGSDEIIADIEARIAELFSEKMENDRQVITMKEVDDVIAVMGQPEDYHVDEDLFDEPQSASSDSETKRSKKLFRDWDNKYIGGVCAGLQHYLGIDALWIRILFLILAIFGSGFGLILYFVLWILVPEATTTAEKLDMRGEPINISNIEKKVKEGIDDVAEKVKNVDYDKMGNRVKSGSRSFFEGLSSVLGFLVSLVGKFIGIILIIVGASTLVALFIGLFTAGVVDVIHVPGVDFYNLMNITGIPAWAISTLVFFAVGIPFFFLFYLGLKILVNNLKSLGGWAKAVLVLIWVAAVGTLVVIGVKQASMHAYTGQIKEDKALITSTPIDTLSISMGKYEYYNSEFNMEIDGMSMQYDGDGEKILHSEDVRFDILPSEDDQMRIEIIRNANGANYKEAREMAEKIIYNYRLDDKRLILDDYLLTDWANKFRDQEIRIKLYLPVGQKIVLKSDTRYHLGYRTLNANGYYSYKMIDHLWEMTKEGKLICLDCPIEEDEEEEAVEVEEVLEEEVIEESAPEILEEVELPQIEE